MVQLKTITIMLFFLEEIQIIHSINLHFLKPYISKICNSFSYYIYNLEFN